MSQPPFAPIAVAYRVSTASTAICALEAAGFDVFCPGYHVANTLPQYALAIGGIAICVRRVHEEDALILLHSFDFSEPLSETMTCKTLNGLGLLTFGVSSPWPDLLLKDIPCEWLDTSDANR